MKILFVRTPRYLWPFNSEASSFWQPLGFASLAAALRQAGHTDVEILDCPVLKIGWKSLAKILLEKQPDVLGIGEETVSANEGLRLAGLARELLPKVKIVCGGHFFTYMVEETLRAHPVDFIVRFEGETTLVELVGELERANPRLDRIRGIAYREGEEIVVTPPRPLIANLDDLPLPAWDLLPMELYGRGSRNHPALAALQHSRGCTCSCSFCVVWRTMGEVKQNGCAETIAPRWRTKSPARMLEEVEILVRKYGRRTLGWVDDTWNADPKWSQEFCAELIKRRYPIQSTHWMRADYIVRDEELGVLETQVRAGMVQAIIGVERAEDTELLALAKRSNGPATTRKAIEILRTKYPQVFVIASLIYGLENESRQSIDRLVRFVSEVDIDYTFILALTPNPGTDVWREAKAKGLIEVDDFSAYNFHTPIMRSKYLSREELETIYFKRLLLNGAARPRLILGNLFDRAHPRRRTAFASLFKHGIRLVQTMLWTHGRQLLGGRKRKPLYSNYSIRPSWYES